MTKPKIISDPKVMFGKPVIEGTRITVEFILEALGAGETPESLIASHPTLTREGVLAALGFAADVMRNEAIYQLGDRAV